jgi:hypothetical protein
VIEWVIPGRLARSARPGAPATAETAVDPAAVEAWLGEARALGIGSILCLLSHSQLKPYEVLPGGLLAHYRRAGFAVGHIPIEDHQTPPIPPEKLDEVVRLYENLPAPLLVHCWAGIDRTGAAVEHILKARSRD